MVLPRHRRDAVGVLAGRQPRRHLPRRPGAGQLVDRLRRRSHLHRRAGASAARPRHGRRRRVRGTDFRLPRPAAEAQPDGRRPDRRRRRHRTGKTVAEIAIWGVIAALGLATFATRLSFLALLGEGELPLWLRRILHYVPPAILAAIIAPQVLAGAPGLAATLDGPRTLAALAGFAVALLTRSTFATIAVGMAVLWGLTLVQW
ncbi:MAG: hypothetical protein C3F19_08605 [Rhodocyclales bacterium]|nr:MAG: hypothetical protein C3F19_08605 [Rhodocyclales bacterium]